MVKRAYKWIRCHIHQDNALEIIYSNLHINNPKLYKNKEKR